MTNENEKINENFNKCIEWIKEKVNKLGNNPLYVGFGDGEYNHPWNGKEFGNKEYSLQIDNTDTPNIKIVSYGPYYMQIFGYDKEDIENWENHYNGTGMVCPRNRHTLEDFGIGAKEKFLLDWRKIKDKISDRFLNVSSMLNDFVV